MDTLLKRNSRQFHIIIVAVLIIGALFPPMANASAQDEAPPEAGETVEAVENGDGAASDEVSTETETPAEDQVVGEETPADTTSQAEDMATETVEESSSDAEPSSRESIETVSEEDEIDTSTETGTDSSTETAVEDQPEIIAEVVDSLAEHDLIMMDKTGEIIPLASEEAAVILATADPYFSDGVETYGWTNVGSAASPVCAAGVTVCTFSENPITDAIADSRYSGQQLTIEAGDYSNNDVVIAKAVNLNPRANLTVKTITLQNGAVINWSTSDAIQYFLTAPLVFVQSGAYIQDGVEMAEEGGTVDVAAGTYVEQVQIVNKNIDLIGHDAVIQSPNTLVQLGRPGKKPVVYITGTTDALIDGFTIDGAHKGSANNSFIGVEFYNAGGTLQNSKIINVMDTTFSGVQHGVGLYVYNDAGVATTMRVLNNQIYDFQKNATAFFGPDLIVDIEDNIITGAGPTDVTAQNGIQITDASGTVKNNTVSGIYWTGTKWAASAILLQYTANLQVIGNQISLSNMGVYDYGTVNTLLQGNTIDRTDYGIYSYASDGLTVDGNTVFDNEYGLLTFSTNSLNATGNTIYGNVYGMWDDGSMNPTINSNTVDNNSYGLIFYPYYYPSVDPYNPTISSNIISDNGIGIGFYGDIDGASANLNKLSNNGTDMESSGSIPVDATDNWWGDNNGPVDVGGLLDTSTWLQLGLDANPTTVAPGGVSNLTPFMYSSGDAARTPVAPLWWFNPLDVVNTEMTSLGNVAGSLFTAGLNEGLAFLAGTYEGLTNDNLASVRIEQPFDPGKDDGDLPVAPPIIPAPAGVVPVAGGGVIPVTGGLNQLSCTLANTLMLANGNSVSFSTPLCGFEGGLIEEAGGSFASPLPDGLTFVSGMTVSLQKDGTEFPHMPEPVTSTVSFTVPDDIKDKTLVILFWDASANGGLGGWVELPGSAGGSATVDYTGTFVLAYK